MEQHALSPDNTGTMFSGSAVVDWDNTAGLQKGDEKTIVLLYTAAGGTSPESKGQPYTQCMAYSTDRGRTFTKYAGNPVLPNVVKENRDPKVVWHAPTRRWALRYWSCTGRLRRPVQAEVAPRLCLCEQGTGLPSGTPSLPTPRGRLRRWHSASRAGGASVGACGLLT